MGEISVRLVPHPESGAGAVRSIATRVRRLPASLQVEYRLEGDLSRVRIPPAAPPRRVDDLWRHTCCELFVQREAPAYEEFNFSPSGEWAAYAFRSYREPAAAPEVAVTIRFHQDLLQAEIPLQGGKITVAPTAVVEDAGGVLSYWALRHPPGKPDFHDFGGYVLRFG